MKRQVFAACIALFMAQSATAQTAEAPPPPGFSIAKESRQIAFVNAGPAGERVYAKGDLILDVPIVWEFAVRLIDPITIVAGAESVALPVGAVLPAVSLYKAHGFPAVRGYCTPRKASERMMDKGADSAFAAMIWRKILRDASDKQFCLIDSDQDGIMEQSVVVNAGTPEMRTPVAITHPRMESAARTPISDQDRLKIRVHKIAQDGTVTFQLEILQQGHTRGFSRFGDTDQLTVVPMKGVTLPVTVKMVRTQFEVVASDGVARKVTVRWPEGANPAAVVVIPDQVTYQ